VLVERRAQLVEFVEVEIFPGRILNRETVISKINQGWESFYTSVGGQMATVIVRSCPYCYASDYITTTPDSTTKNNLLSLSGF